MNKKAATKQKAKFLVTKHFGNGMMHHVGSPKETIAELEPFLKDADYRGGFTGRVWLSVWKIVEEIEVTREIK